jgi:acyl-CoA thioester hydrolase
MTDLKILDDFKLNVQIQVAWIDMDSLGHVNSSKYFTYFETARVKYYENLGLLDYFKSNNISGVVAKTDCCYFVPLNYPDTIMVGARVTELKSDFFVMEYYIKSNMSGLAAIGEAEIAVFDFSSNKKIEIPENVSSKIINFEDNYFKSFH